MKEIDEIEELEINTNQNQEEPAVEEDRPTPGTPDDSVFDGLKAAYDKATSLEVKYEYYTQMKLYLEARSSANQNTPDDMEDTFSEIENSLLDTLENSDTKTIGKFVRKLNYSVRENAAQYEEDKKIYNNLISPDEANADKKNAFLLTNCSLGGYQLRVKALTTNNIMARLRFSEQVVYNIVNDLDIYLNMTVKDFATKCGFKGQRLDEYIEHLSAKPDENIKTAIGRHLKILAYREDLNQKKIVVPEEDKDQVINDPYSYAKETIDAYNVTDGDIQTFIREDAAFKWLDNQLETGRQNYFKKNKLNKASVNKLEANINDARSEFSSKIQDWTSENGPGRKMATDLRVVTGRGIINDQKKKLSREKGYDQYIRLHAGYEASHQKKQVAVENLSKAIAANLLKKAGKKFDVDSIHKVAKRVKSLAEFKTIANDPVRLMSSMMDAEAVEKTRSKLIEKTFSVSKDNIENYVSKMRTLYDNMITRGSQSTEHRAFRTAVMKIAKLSETMNLRSEQGRTDAREVLISLNADLLAASEKYMKGKMTVRGTNEGEFRFNNTVDALAIMSRYATGSKELVENNVDKINKARKVSAGHKNFVKLSDYGEKRAEAARKEREPKKNMVKELKNSTMSK